MHKTEDDDWSAPLTAQEAQALRERQPTLSVLRVVGAQVLAGLLVAGLARWWFSVEAAVSALYGMLAVVIPSALFAIGSRPRSASVAAAALRFFLWEGVKLFLTVLALVAAPHVIQPLSWPAMLVAMLSAMKVYWVALGLGPAFSPKKKI